ncbi:Rho GTPase-activating protein 68F, partial [Orchesella cincta]
MMCEPATSTNLGGDGEDPYPSLSDYHDYEPNLEFDDTELEQVASTGKTNMNCKKSASNLKKILINMSCQFCLLYFGFGM